MELEKLEKRRDEIIGFNRELNERMRKVVEASKKLQEEYIGILDQYKVNMGSLSENNQWIESIKKKDTEPIAEKVEEKEEEIKKDKKK